MRPRLWMLMLKALIPARPFPQIWRRRLRRQDLIAVKLCRVAQKPCPRRGEMIAGLHDLKGAYRPGRPEISLAGPSGQIKGRARHGQSTNDRAAGLMV